MSSARRGPLGRLTHIGVNPGDPPIVIQPIVLANGLSLACIIATALVVVVDIVGGGSTISRIVYSSASGVAIPIVVIVLNALRKRRAASVALYLTLLLSTLGAAVLMKGARAGVHYFYLPIIILTFQIYPAQTRRLALAFAAVLATLFVSICVILALYPDYWDNIREYRSQFAANLSLVALSTVILAHYAQSVTHATRAQLREVHEQTDALIRQVLPQRLVDELREGADVVGKRSPAASIIVADIVGFTRLSEECAPEDLVDHLNALFSAFDDACTKAGAEKIKTVGDAYIAGVGLDATVDNSGETAARVAHAMLAALAGVEACTRRGIRVRIGVATGEVISGVVRTNRLAYDAWGETVERAQKMEAAAPPGGIAVDKVTWSQLRERGGVTCGEGGRSERTLYERPPNSVALRD